MRILVLSAFCVAVMATPALALDKGTDRAAARANFQQSDTSKDGKLNKAEFRKFIDANAADDIGRASMVKRFGAYDRAFSRVDANKDGTITPKELAASQGK